MTEERKQEFLSRLLVLEKSDDPEVDHQEADGILLEILEEIGGYDDIIAAYSNIDKYYS